MTSTAEVPPVHDDTKGEGNASPAERAVPSRTNSQASPSASSRRKEIKLNNRYIVKTKLGGGSFGDIYRGLDTQTNKEVAVKMEHTRARHAQLQYESRVYKILHDHQPEIIGVPAIHWFGAEEHYNAMVMELCGPCLEDLFNYCLRDFSLKTVLMLADQMLNRLEFIHGKGIIHRDIKPENFVFGLNEKGHVLQIIDFGLCKRYFDKTNNKHIPFRDGKPLTGTARYCSANAHRGLEQSRRDDLESIGYLLIYFYIGQLPWQGIAAADAAAKTMKIGEKKINTLLEDLCKDCPPEFLEYMKYCKKLDFMDDPDYNYLRNLFAERMSSIGESYDWQFDWFTKRDKEHQEAREGGSEPSEVIPLGRASSATGISSP